MHDAQRFGITVRPNARNSFCVESQVMVDKPNTVLCERLGPVFGRVSDEALLTVNRAVAACMGLA